MNTKKAPLLTISQPHRQNKGNAYRIIPHLVPKQPELQQQIEAGCEFQDRSSQTLTSLHLSKHLQHAVVAGQWPTIHKSKVKSTEKIWAIGDRFQDVPGVDCRQKCHNSHDIWGRLRKNIIAPAPSSYPSKTTPKHFPCKWIVNTASFGRGQRNRIWCICRPFAAYLPHFLFIVWNYDNCVFMHKTRPSQESNWALAAHFRSVFFSNLSLALLGRHTCSADVPVPINMPKRR